MVQCFQTQFPGQLKKGIGENLFQTEACSFGDLSVKQYQRWIQRYIDIDHRHHLIMMGKIQKTVIHPMQTLDMCAKIEVTKNKRFSERMIRYGKR